jgi:hypothetical protein
MKNEMNQLAARTLAALKLVSVDEARTNAARNIAIARELDLAERASIASEISDVSKEAWGFRTRVDYRAFTKAELLAELEEWYGRARAEVAFEQEQADLAKQDERDHVAAVQAAMTPTASFTIGDMFPA